MGDRGQCIKLMVALWFLRLLFITVALGGCQPRQDKAQGAKYALQQKEVVMIIEEMTRDLLSQEVTVDRLIRRLGKVLEKQSGSGYRLLPIDPLFREVWLGVEESQGETPRYIELMLSQPSPLTMAQMNTVFGEWTLLPRRDYNAPIVIQYVYDRVELFFEGVILLSLSNEPDAPDTRILAITIRREERM